MATGPQGATAAPQGPQGATPVPAGPMGATPVSQKMPLSVFGVQVAEDTPEVVRPIFGFSQEFVKGMAQIAATPVEAMDQALRLTGVKLLEEPGDAIEASRGVFHGLGIPEQPVSELVAQLGKEGAEALVSLAAFTAAAPSLLIQAGRQAPSTVRGVLDQIGRVILQQPAITAGAEAGAVAGGVVGEREFGPAGRVVGALTGGMIAGEIPNMARVGGKMIPVVAAGATGATVGGLTLGLPGAAGLGGLGVMATNRAFLAARRAGQRLLGAAPSESPILSARREGVAISAARDIQERELAAVEDEVATILDELPRGAETMSSLYKAGLDRAQRTARGIESRAYSEDFLAQPTSPEPLLDAARAMRQGEKAASPKTPTTEIERILAEFNEPLVTAGEIQDMRSDLLWAARDAASGEKPNKPLARNLNMLADAALEALRPVDEEAVENALRISSRLNDLFFKGPLGTVMKKTRRGEPTVAPEKTVDKLLKQPRGFRQIEPIADEFESPSLRPLTQAAVRATFRAAVERDQRAVGTAAEAWMRNNDSAIKSLGAEAIKLQRATDRLVAAQARKLGVEKGALSRFLRNDPDAEKALRNVINAPNPAQTAGEIRSKMLAAGDTDAVSAFEQDMLAELLRRHDYSAVRFKEELDRHGKIRRLVEASAPDLAPRLFALIERAAMIESGETTIPGVSRSIVVGPVMGLISRIAGAGVVKEGSRLTGSGATIQATGAGATFAKSFTQRITGKIDPADIFAMAVRDPKFEQLLANEVPLDTKSFKDFNLGVRALISTYEATRPRARK